MRKIAAIFLSLMMAFVNLNVFVYAEGETETEEPAIEETVIEEETEEEPEESSEEETEEEEPKEEEPAPEEEEIPEEETKTAEEPEESEEIIEPDEENEETFEAANAASDIMEILFRRDYFMMSPGKYTDAEVLVFPEDLEDKTVVWSSSNEFVATVNDNGRIHAEGYGLAEITASSPDGSVSAECTVSVGDSGDDAYIYAGGSGTFYIKEGETSNIPVYLENYDLGENVT